jgi:hypothetical protein
MRKFNGLFLVLFGALLVMGALERHSVGWGVLADRYASSYSGDLYVVTPSGEQPYLTIYDAPGAEWDTIFQSNTFSSDVIFEAEIDRRVFRQDFNCGTRVREAADGTAELVSDAGVNNAFMTCGDIRDFNFRIDGAQASPFIVNTEGKLDLDNDGTDDEGVYIIVGETNIATTMTPYVYGQSWYLRVGFDIESVDGTDNIQIGWRLNEAYVDNQVLATPNTYGAWAWNSSAGNAIMATGDDTVDATDEVTGADLSENETIHVEVILETDGTFSFRYGASEAALEASSEVTQVNTINAAFVAGDVMLPFIAMLHTTNADTEMMIDYIEIGRIS